ncbi:MAG: cysteine--tRNA ligase [Anaerolineae bacterium]
MTLYVYNSLTRTKEPFEPLHEGFVGMYVCGPTVYDDAHVGHGKTYVNFDVVVRYFRYLGYRVRYVQNITDVGHLLDTGEDRILRGAQRERVEPMEVVERYTRRYFEDMDALNVTRPDISPRASGHVPEQIELVKELLAKGYAYEADGSVYFDVSKWPDYGKLSGRRVEELVEGTRIGVREEKRHPADFALWRRAEPEHIMRWPSPWGWGFPGWHVECSVMATKYLGQPFDIHAGGMENKFPHHECEIAQSEAAYGKPFARYWLHNGMLMIRGEEMHKSLGNFVTLRQAFERYDPMAIRFFILSAHYRSPLDFTEEAMQAATSGLERLRDAVAEIRWRLERAPAGEAAPSIKEMLGAARERFEEAMNDDFNTPQALAALFDLTREFNSLLAEASLTRGDLEAMDGFYRRLAGDALGLRLDRLLAAGEGDLVEGLIQILVDLRQEYRAARDWARADALRGRLAALGVELLDGPEGTRWRVRGQAS